MIRYRSGKVMMGPMRRRQNKEEIGDVSAILVAAVSLSTQDDADLEYSVCTSISNSITSLLANKLISLFKYAFEKRRLKKCVH